MKLLRSSSRWPTPGRRQWIAAFSAAMACVVAALVACGGGSSGMSSRVTPSSAPATTVFAAGPISGFGSVIVNGVRFDDDTATIVDDDGQALTDAQLRLGMQCEVDGTADADDRARGHARSVRVRSALLGPVGSTDTRAGTLTVLGQTVAVDGDTAFDDAIVGGLAGLGTGTVVAVHAQFDAASRSYLATRIELAAAAAAYKIRGTVTALDPVAQTLQIGLTPISYATAIHVPSTLAVGSVVVARLGTTAAAGVWTARSLVDARPPLHDQDDAHLRGAISAFTSDTLFSVGGTPVDASHATFRVGEGGLSLGVQVDAEGQFVDGVLIARTITIEGLHDNLSQAIELHGRVGALDTTARTFLLHGVTVHYAAATFVGGTAQALADGLFVEVDGSLASGGNGVAATRIDLAAADRDRP